MLLAEFVLSLSIFATKKSFLQSRLAAKKLQSFESYSMNLFLNLAAATHAAKLIQIQVELQLHAKITAKCYAGRV